MLKIKFSAQFNLKEISRSVSLNFLQPRKPYAAFRLGKVEFSPWPMDWPQESHIICLSNFSFAAVLGRLGSCEYHAQTHSFSTRNDKYSLTEHFLRDGLMSRYVKNSALLQTDWILLIARLLIKIIIFPLSGLYRRGIQMKKYLAETLGSSAHAGVTEEP